MVMNWKEALFF